MPLNSNTKLVRASTAWIQKDVNRIIWEIWLSVNDVLILTTGSSWRAEKYWELDDVELLVYFLKNDLDLNIQELCEILKNNGKFEFLVEDKLSENSPYFEWFIWEKVNKVFFPSRHIDSRIIFWETDSLNQINSTFIDVIKSLDWWKIDDWKTRIRTHKNISLSGGWKWKWEPYKIFDVESKTLFYAKEKNGRQVSLKLWMLRYIQYKIVSIIINLIRKWKIDNNNISKIWRSMNQKLDFLADFWLSLNNAQINELKFFYSYFVELHNRMVQMFPWHTSGSFQLNENDFREFIASIKAFNPLVQNLNLQEKNKAWQI